MNIIARAAVYIYDGSAADPRAVVRPEEAGEEAEA